jgi:hypothetical protein
MPATILNLANLHDCGGAGAPSSCNSVQASQPHRWRERACPGQHSRAIIRAQCSPLWVHLDCEQLFPLVGLRQDSSPSLLNQASASALQPVEEHFVVEQQKRDLDELVAKLRQ